MLLVLGAAMVFDVAFVATKDKAGHCMAEKVYTGGGVAIAPLVKRDFVTPGGATGARVTCVNI